MSYILYAGKAPNPAFAQALRDAGRELRCITTLEDARALLKSAAPALIVLDMALPQVALREAVISLLMVDARVHCAVVTDMAADDFHDAMEGLGILMPLPVACGAADAAQLLHALDSLPC